VWMMLRLQAAASATTLTASPVGKERRQKGSKLEGDKKSKSCKTGSFSKLCQRFVPIRA
jgi:hypothetical protein